MKHEEVLRAIRERPDDDELRLVYADALEEANQSLLAEHLRLALANDPRAADLREAREKELVGPILAAHARAWDFERGLVDFVKVPLTPLLAHGSEILRAAPIRRLAALDDDEDEETTAAQGRALAAIPELAQVQTLDVMPMSFTTELVAAWLGSPHWTRLASLTFSHGVEEELAEIVTSAALPALTDLLLWMESGSKGDDVARMLAKSERRSGLRRLEISGIELGDEGVIALAESAFLRSVERLLLGSSSYSSSVLGVAALNAIARWSPSLRHLELPGTGITDQAVAALVNAKSFCLDVLGLEENRISTEGLAVLVRAPCLSSLKELDLSANDLDDGAVPLLVDAPFAPTLERVVLRATSIGPEGLAELRTKLRARVLA